ncbi:MAG: hypothetical protein NVV66_16320 [Cellulomonas sp.]|uniref:hypothetical protein n=1 Tax=Cellulomonas sp. TaxID=40001 RepID=UPI002584B187|nr:hypothetical protein [Cellulomonas sp.]MCR6706182.1 hypothetical protein [Cellulomonas sp.]
MDAQVRMLGLVGRWPEDDLARLVDAFGAVGCGLPDDPAPLLADLARGRQQPEQH